MAVSKEPAESSILTGRLTRWSAEAQAAGEEELLGAYREAGEGAGVRAEEELSS